MTNPEYNFKAGESLTLNITVLNTGGTAVDLTGHTAIHARLYIKELNVAQFADTTTPSFNDMTLSTGGTSGTTYTLSIPLTREITKKFPVGYLSVVVLVEINDTNYTEYQYEIGQVSSGKMIDDLHI